MIPIVPENILLRSIFYLTSNNAGREIYDSNVARLYVKSSSYQCLSGREQAAPADGSSARGSKRICVSLIDFVEKRNPLVSEDV